MTGLNVVIIFWLFHGKACDECVEFRHWDSEHDTGTKQLYTAKGHSQGIERNNRGRGSRREAGGKWRRGSKGQGLDLNRDYFGIYHSKEMEQKKNIINSKHKKSIVDVKVRHQFIFTCSIFSSERCLNHVQLLKNTLGPLMTPDISFPTLPLSHFPLSASEAVCWFL